jgi:hypothetical protein
MLFEAGINLLKVYCGLPLKLVALKNNSTFEPFCGGDPPSAILIKYGDRANILAIISFRF